MNKISIISMIMILSIQNKLQLPEVDKVIREVLGNTCGGDL